MRILLLMPIQNDNWGESENLGDERCLGIIRDYLYWRLEHPNALRIRSADTEFIQHY